MLLDSAGEQASTLASTLEGRLQVLKSISASLALSDLSEPEAIDAYLAEVAQTAGLRLSSLDLIRPDGYKAAGWESDAINVADREYFQRAMAGEAAMQSVTGKRTRRKCIMLAVPYYQKGEVAGVLRGLYYEEDMRALLNSQVYGGGGYSYLISSSGKIIVNAESDENLTSKNSLFDALESATFQQGDSLEKLKKDLLAGERGTVHYIYNSQPRVAVLVPLGGGLPQNDWFVYNVVNEESLLPEIKASRRDSIESMAVFGGFAVVSLVLFMLLENDYRNKKRKENEMTRQREEQFRIVTEQSGKFVMRYDIPTKTAYRSDADDDGFGGDMTCADFCEGTIARGRIDSASTEDYRDFFSRVDAGESPVVGDILMITPGGERRWIKHVSTTIYDSKKRPSTAIISYFDNTEQRERELAYAKWQQELDGIPYESAALYEWNLTKDVCDGQRGSLALPFDLEHDSFNERAEYLANGHIAEDDRAAFLTMMSREHLMVLYFSGIYQCSLDYRHIDEGSEARWRRLSVQLVPYPDGEDIKAYVTVRDIDDEKREELDLVSRSQRDYLTGAYNRETFILRVNEIIAKNAASAHALLMLDVDGFKRVNDQLGHDAGDQVLKDIAGYIRTVLRASDIIGRVGGDEFMVFLPDMPFDAAITRKAAQLCAAMRHRLNNRLSISVSVGIAVYPRDGADFAELYKCSDAALYRAKSVGKDGYAFYRKQLPDAALSESSAVTLTTVPERHAVLVATDNNEVADTVSEALKTEYDPILIDKSTDLDKLLSSKNAVYVCIIDADSSLGVETLNYLGERLISHGLTLYAVVGDRSDDTYLDLLHRGVTLAFSKPVNKDLLLLRLDMLYSSRDIQRTHFQSEFRRLQTTEERRYREVLSATGTTVFIYDVATRTYQADLLAQQYTSGAFEGRELGAEMVQKGILSSEDVETIKSSMASVESGSAEKPSHTVLLTTKTGEKRWFNIQIMKLENADVLSPKLIITANDVNEAVEAERALRLRAETDALTGLYNREAFIEKASAMIAEHESGYYIMACFDIDNFKVFNDQYGSDKGDEALKFIAKIFERGFGAMGGVCCRVMADNFAVLYPRSFMNTPQIAEIRQAAAQLDGSAEPITFSIGRYLVTDKKLSVSAMFDRASIAESSVKGRFDTNIAQYDESMREHILREQEIINEMKTALEKENFEVWLQPQYNHSSGALIGAEALVRWRHPKRGLIPPAEFIPVFERNGFIYEMDKFMWERSCILLRDWIDEGRDPLALSVNVSRYDIFRDDFFEFITGLVESYAIPVQLLRLEITESAFAQSTEQIIAAVRRLVDYGFIIEIDDFGSGYSSLNTLKDVPASVLKLDMRFLENNKNSSRGGNILESVVRMARWLGMSVIAEGVETIEQADYLRTIGCNYVQGFLYAKPMPVSEYEKLSAASGKENRLTTLETVASLDNDAFWDPKSMETLIFNSYVGGACIFEYLDGKTELLRVNEKYAEALGSDGMSMDEALALDLAEHMDADNLGKMRDNIERAIETRKESTCEVSMFGLPGKRVHTYLRVTVRLLAQTGARRLLYAGVIDVSAQREAEHKERETSEQMKAIMKNVNGGVTAVTIGDDNTVSFIFANDKYYSIFGYTREQFEKEVTDAFELVHPDDRERIKKTVDSIISDRALAVYEYRCFKRGGQIINVRCNASMTAMEGISDSVLLSVTTDITELTRAERRAVETSERLEAIMSNVNGGITAVTIIDGHPHFLFANDMYFEQLGYTREQFEAEVSDAFELVYPDDREQVVRLTKDASVTREPFSCTYRAKRRDGSLVWMQSNISICDFDGVDAPVQLAVANDITAAKEADRTVIETSRQLFFLNETAHDLFVQTDVDDGIELVLRKVLDYFRGERAYIIELDYTKGVSSNTYEVCAEGVKSEMARQQGVPREVSQFLWTSFKDGEYINITDVDALDDSRETERLLLQAQGIRSLIAVPLRRGDDLIGFICVDDPSRNKSHVGHLMAIGDYLSAVLARRDLTAKIESDRNTILELMNDTPGGFARMKLWPDGLGASFVYANDGFCKLVDMTNDEVMALYGKDAMAGVHPNDKALLSAAHSELIESGGNISVKYRLRRGKEGYIWLMVFGRLTKSPEGEAFLNAYYTDMSELNRLEEQRREMLDNIPCGAGIFEVDGSGIEIIYLNRSYAELVGRSTDEKGSASPLASIHHEDLKRLYAELEFALANDTNIDFDIHILHGDGEYRPFRLVGKTVHREGAHATIYAAFFPLTDEEQTLRELLPITLAAMMESSSDMAFVKDRSLTYICCSRVFAEMVGLKDASEIAGLTDFDLFERELAEQYRADDLELIENGQSLVDYIERIPSEGGAERYSKTSKYLLHDSAGNVIGLYGTGRNLNFAEL